MLLPSELITYHRRLFGDDFGGFINYFNETQNRWSLRVNTVKSSVRDVKRMLSFHNIDYGPVSWCAEGLWASDGNLDFPEHQMGFYYIQSASSMIAPQILGAGEMVLDLCAAPGGKTTHLAQMMRNSKTLIANEHVPSRMKALVYNIQRCGIANTTVIKGDGCRIGNLGLKFDKILVDAPCSGVGTLRQSREILGRWSMEWVLALSGLQQKLMIEAYDCLHPGGTLVYTTCTTTLEENEKTVEKLLSERDDASLENVRLEGVKLRRGLTEKTRNCARIYPQDDGLDPHFFAKVTKNG
jgi:16S rRNA (cytosine1407-C5)-methyltransferase